MEERSRHVGHCDIDVYALVSNFLRMCTPKARRVSLPSFQRHMWRKLLLFTFEVGRPFLHEESDERSHGVRLLTDDTGLCCVSDTVGAIAHSALHGDHRQRYENDGIFFFVTKR